MKRAGAALAFAALASSGIAKAEPVETVFGLNIAIARENGARIVDDAWVRAQIDEANGFYVPLGYRVRWTHEDDLPEPHGEMHTRADRDALHWRTVRTVINVFIVRELEDVDEPGPMRMGVCWTVVKEQKTFLVVSRTAKPTVLAHELGHFFGNHVHSTVKNNLMSYDRDGANVLLDAQQQAIVKATAKGLLGAGVLIDVGEARRLF